MKRLWITPIILLVICLLATPVFAVDPPDTEVDVTVVTPGDVDLDVDIIAGGDVDVTVDGVDLKATASTAQTAYDKAFGFNSWNDFILYWRLTGIGPNIQGQIDELQAISVLLMSAEAKLIQEQELNEEELSSIQTMLASFGKTNAETASALGTFGTEMTMELDSLQGRDDEIWNQLMYGAEAHITLLEGLTAEQESRIAMLQTETTSLSTELETARANQVGLLNYVDYLQRQYLYYFWILGGVMIVLTTGLIVALKRKAD